nr:antitoxin [Mycobacterium tuberculosis]
MLSDEEREAFRQQAAAQQMSLSNWLRQAGLRQLEAQRQRPLRTAQELREFFASRPDETGAEPDWQAHLRGMAESPRRGLPAP